MDLPLNQNLDFVIEELTSIHPKKCLILGSRKIDSSFYKLDLGITILQLYGQNHQTEITTYCNFFSLDSVEF